MVTMRTKLGLATIVLAVLPTLTLAGGGCPFGGHKQAISCAEGMVWDSASQACVERSTS
jgi:hypothetical protein